MYSAKQRTPNLHALLSKEADLLPSLIGEPAGGSLTADQWLVFCTIVAPLILWQEYIPEESPQELAQRRAREIAATLEAKRTAAAAARQAQTEPLAGKRARKPTARAAVRDINSNKVSWLIVLPIKEMDIDPDDTVWLDAGANDDSDDDSYGLNPTQQKKRKKKQQQDKQTLTLAEQEAVDNATPPNLHPDDPKNFLKLSTAVRILVGRIITEADLTKSDKLLREYTAELVDLYGPEVIRPNHHYATHTPMLLKSYKTPNHAGGELESSFFREFQRTVQQSRLLAQGAREPVGSALREAVELMYHATADDRGTVQALARDLDTAREDGGIVFKLSTRAEKGQLAAELYFCILRHLQIRLPDVKLHSFVQLAPSPDSLMLEPQGILFDHVIINHSRYLASSRTPRPHNSFIAVRSSATATAPLWVGELRSIVAIQQPGTSTIHRFGYMRWFRPTVIELSGTGVVSVIWDANTYLQATDNGPDFLIDLQDITSHVVCMDVVIRGQMYWATIPTGKLMSFTEDSIGFGTELYATLLIHYLGLIVGQVLKLSFVQARHVELQREKCEVRRVRHCPDLLGLLANKDRHLIILVLAQAFKTRNAMLSAERSISPFLLGVGKHIAADGFQITRVPVLLADFPPVVATTGFFTMSLEDVAGNLAAVRVLRRHVVGLDRIVIADGVFLAMDLSEFGNGLAMVVRLLHHSYHRTAWPSSKQQQSSDPRREHRRCSNTVISAMQ
ncbi:hypothetical protein C8R44DRAFT_947747, partial [Mycena epipterygia]